MGCDADGFTTDDAAYAHPRAGLSLDERTAVRTRVLDVAAGMFNASDLRILELHLDGHNVTEIAKQVGRLRPNVSRSLNGAIMPRVRAALAKDPALAAVAQMEAAPEPPRRWFASILSPPHPERFVALAVLREIAEHADAKRECTYTTLYEVLGRKVVDFSIPTLRTLGFITSDGHTVRILRTPID